MIDACLFPGGQRLIENGELGEVGCDDFEDGGFATADISLNGDKFLICHEYGGMVKYEISIQPKVNKMA